MEPPCSPAALEFTRSQNGDAGRGDSIRTKAELCVASDRAGAIAGVHHLRRSQSRGRLAFCGPIYDTDGGLRMHGGGGGLRWHTFKSTPGLGRD
jgi:hypothetical protein